VHQDYTRRLRALAPVARQLIRAELPADSGDATTAVFRLYDPVDSWGGEWGVSAKEFAAALDALPDTVNEIRLHINSPGGEVFEGIAILNALRNHDARVVAVVDGIAASAASFIAAGADELVMARNSELMIHDAWGLVVGNAADMRQMADTLDHLSNNIASVYADKSGGDVADWRAAMAAETWYSAEEAVAAGLADRVDKKSNAAKNHFDLSIFTYAGRDNAPGPTTAAINSGQLTPNEARVLAGLPEESAPSTEATDPDDAPVTEPEDAADEELFELVARSLERLAQAT
jgi:ATP-dependent Clp endopeptidase proteolytic subunit ClpP